MKFLQALLLACLLAAPAHAEEWSSEAVRSLPYLYHEADLKADLAVMDQAFQRAYVYQLQSYYLAELNKNQTVINNGLVPLSFESLSQDYVGLYDDFRRQFLNRVAHDTSDLLSQLEREERQAFRTQLTSQNMTELRDYYLAYPKFFALPLSYSNALRFVEPVEAEDKHDLANRQVAAGVLVESLRLQQANYALEGDELHAPSMEMIEKNFANYLTNEFILVQLASMANFAQSDAGHNYLKLQDSIFRNRFLSLQAFYKKELAQSVDELRVRLAHLPPPVIVYGKLFFHRPHFHKSEDPAKTENK